MKLKFWWNLNFLKIRHTQLELECLNCQKFDKPDFLQVNWQKHVWMALLIIYHTLNRSTNLFSRNHSTLCFWLRREGWQMPNTEQLLYRTEKSSHQKFSTKLLLLKILQYSQENTFVKFLRTPILKNICIRVAVALTLQSDCLELCFWIAFKTFSTQYY